MRNIYYLINVLRSIPMWLIFYVAHGEGKRRLLQDMKLTKISMWILHKNMVDNRYFRRMFVFRMTNDVGSIAKIVSIFYPPAKDFEISGDIGGGVSIFHGYGTIVFAQSVGENLSVYQQVTVGRGKEKNGRNIPVIGNNVSIYTGAAVLGGVTIGNNCKIGAGAVVLQDMPDNSTAVGVPARIIQSKVYRK